MRRSLHIAVIGLGTGGTAVASLLARDGHAVQVYEQAPTPGPVGAGLLLQPTGMGALAELDLLPAALRLGAPIQRLHGETPSGRTVMDLRYADLGLGVQGLGIQRGALHQLLLSALPAEVIVHTGARITQVLAERGRVLRPEGRGDGPFDLIVAADGAGSALRAVLGAQVRLDQPYPWGALWCLLKQRAWPWPDELRQRYRGTRQMLGMLPVGIRADDPIPRISFFWSLPAHAPPITDLDRWRTSLSALWPAFADHAAQLQDPAQCAWARYRDVRVAPRWHYQRLVLLGDAAHAMSPQLGQGVNMALLDALALRDALRRHPEVPVALATYARTRQQHVRIYQFWSRWLTPLFQSEGRVLGLLRDLAFHPMGRLPLLRSTMLKVLSGTRLGWFGSIEVPQRVRRELRTL